MKLNLVRFVQTQETTLGLLFIDGDFACFTLEDAHRDQKVAGKTRIPSGTYPIGLANYGDLNKRYKTKFKEKHKGMLILQNVPGFTGILIHMGNTKEHTEGCILVGASCNPILATIIQSEVAYTRIYPAILKALEAKQSVSITIQNSFPLK